MVDPSIVNNNSSSSHSGSNHEGMTRKKRGRPMKGQEGSSGTVGEPLATATANDAPRIREKRGLSKVGSTTVAHGSAVMTRDNSILMTSEAARLANQKAQQESIRQQQALAQAQSKAFRTRIRRSLNS